MAYRLCRNSVLIPSCAHGKRLRDAKSPFNDDGMRYYEYTLAPRSLPRPRPHPPSLSVVALRVRSWNGQRGGGTGGGGETYQQLLATDADEAEVTPPGSPAMKGFRRHKKRMSRHIGGRVENLWRTVRTLSCCLPGMLLFLFVLVGM